MWFQLLSSSTESEYSSLSWLPTADVGEWTCTPVFPVPLELSSSVTEDPDREELFAVVAWSIVMLKLVARATVSDASHKLHCAPDMLTPFKIQTGKELSSSRLLYEGEDRA